MANTGISKNGKVINVQDRVSIVSKVVSVAGSGSLAQVTLQAPLDAGTYVAQSNDCGAVEHQSDASHLAVSVDGKPYGAAGNDVTARGLVTSISGSGITAVLTVVLSVSQTTITTLAGNVSSDNV